MVQAATVPEGVLAPTLNDLAFQPHTTYVYDVTGNLIESTDPAGHRTHANFDRLGRPTAIIEAYGTAIARTTAYGYDALDHVVSVAKSQAGQTTVTTLLGYDSLGRKVQQIDAAGAGTANLDHASPVTTYKYFVGGQLKEQMQTVNSVVYSSASFGYDSLGNQNLIIENAGVTLPHPAERRTTMKYDAAGNRIEVTDTRGVTTTSVYDAFGRVWEVSGETLSLYEYDSANNQIVRKEGGFNYIYNFDLLGRKKQSFVNSNNNATQVETPTNYFYDAAGNQIEVRQEQDFGYIGDLAWNAANGVPNTVQNRTTYQYDALGRVVRTYDPHGNYTFSSYHADNRLKLSWDCMDRKRWFEYDALGRKTSETWDARPLGNPTGPFQTVDVLSFQYDMADHVVHSSRSADAEVTTARTYDALGRLQTADLPFGVHLSYTYAYQEHARTLSVAESYSGGTSGRTVSSYDAAGRLISRQLTDGNGERQLQVTAAGDTAPSGGSLDLVGSYSYVTDFGASAFETMRAEIDYQANSGRQSHLIYYRGDYVAERLLDKQVWTSTTNRYGKPGDPVHKRTGAYIARELDERGFSVIDREARFATPGSSFGRAYRDVDVLAINPQTKEAAVVQVVRTTDRARQTPHPREFDAMSDVMASPRYQDLVDQGYTIKSYMVRRGATRLDSALQTF